MKVRAHSPGTRGRVPQIRSLLGRHLLLLLWLCFLSRGFFYSAVLPLWEGYDEPFHFAFVQYVALHNFLPAPGTPVSRDVEASLHVAPLSWEQRLHTMKAPILTEDAYWQLPEATRAELQQQLRQIPPAWAAQTGESPVNYEAQQGPLYYWLMSLPLRLTASWTLLGRVFLLRVLSVIIASLVVPLAWAAASITFDQNYAAASVAALIVCLPELMINISRTGNECLGMVFYSLLTLLLLQAAQRRQAKRLVFAGIVLGLGLVTKAYFLLAIPAFVLVVAFYAWRDPDNRVRNVAHAAVGLLLAFLISFSWYWRNHALTGTWSGEENNVAAMHGGMSHVIAAAAHVKWIGGVTAVIVSHIWFGGWSFLKLPKPVYFVFVAGIAISVVGLVGAIVKKQAPSAELFVALALYAFFWLGLLYDTLLVSVATGVSASNGWYMYAVIVPEILLLAIGLYQLVPQRWRGAVLPAVAACFAAIDLYGMFTLLLPYYTGVIAHVPGTDIVHPATAGTLLQHSALSVSRLTVNRPEWLNSSAILLLLMLYVAATLIAVVVPIDASHREQKGAATSA